MIEENALNRAFRDASHVIFFRGGLDTFAFRKGFETELDLSEPERRQLLSYVKEKLGRGTVAYQALKREIDRQEFLSTDYYVNPYPRRFYGAYAPVVFKTFAGVMAAVL